MATLDDVNAEIARRELARRATAAKAPSSTAATSSDGGGSSDVIGAGLAGLQRSTLGGLGLEPGDIEGSVAALLHPHVPSVDDLTPDVSKRDAAMALAFPALALSSAPIKAAKSLIHSVNPDAYDEEKSKEGARLGAEEQLSPLAARIGFALPIATAAAEQGPALARSARASLSNPAVADKVASGLDAAASAAPAAGRVVGGAAGLVKGPVGAFVGYKGGGKLGDTIAKGASKLADKLRDSGALSDWIRPLAEPQSSEAVSSGLDLAREPQASTADIADQLDLLKAKAGLGGRADVTGQLRAMARDAGLLPSGLELARDVAPAPFEPATVGGHPDEPPIADDKAAETMAESLDPGAEGWKQWLLEKPAKPVPRPELDAAAKVMTTGTKADRTPSLRAAAEAISGVPTPENAITTREVSRFSPAAVAGERTVPEIDWRASQGAPSDKQRMAALQGLDQHAAEAPTRELDLKGLRDQEAFASQLDNQPTGVREAARAFKPFSGDVPSPADLAAKDAAANAAVQRMPLASSSPFSQAKVDAAAKQLLAQGMKPADVAAELFKRGLTSQRSMQDPWFAKALANYRAAQIGNLK